MDGGIGGDEGKSISEFKAFLAEAAFLSESFDAQGGLMYELEC